MTRESSARGKSGVLAEPKAVSSGTSGLMLKQDQVLADQIVERARAAWPELNVPAEPFVQRVLALVKQEAHARDALMHLAIEDLFLAYACSQGNPKAFKAFAQDCDRELKAVAAKLKISDSDCDDARQKLWDKLFVDSATVPMKILEYRGAGRLRQWYRAVAGRTLLDGLRQAKHSDHWQLKSECDALAVAAPEADPELASIRRRYRYEFHSSFEAALRSLEPEERNLLRCHYLQSMSTGQVAKAFGTHKATAARRVARAREKLVKYTRKGLKERLKANSGELESVMRLFDGELSVSLSKYLE